MAESEAEQGLLEAWRINDRINRYMLESIATEALPGASASKGRTVGQQFAHIHTARLMWLEVAAKDLMDGLVKLDKEQALDKELLLSSLEASGRAIETLLERAVGGARIKGFTKHPAAFMAYLVAHDGYHRGEVGIILAQSGHPLDRKVSYGMWEWGVR